MEAHTWSQDRVWRDVASGLCGKRVPSNRQVSFVPAPPCFFFFFFSFPLLTLLCSLEEKHSFPPLGLFLFFAGVRVCVDSVEAFSAERIVFLLCFFFCCLLMFRQYNISLSFLFVLRDGTSPWGPGFFLSRACHLSILLPLPSAEPLVENERRGGWSTPLPLPVSLYVSFSFALFLSVFLSPMSLTVALPLCCNSLMPYHLPLPILSIKACKKQ